jgi:hypothetical protein
MYYSYVEIEYVATGFSPARTDLALKLLSKGLFLFKACLASRARLFQNWNGFCNSPTHFNTCKPDLMRIFSSKLSFSLFYYCNLLGFLATTRTACVAELSLWTHFLEVSVKDVLPMAYVDACTMKFYFCEFFLAAPIFTSRETFEKLPTEQMFLCKMVVLRETYLAPGRWLACYFCFVSTS